MTLDEARAVLPGLRQISQISWSFHSPDWSVNVQVVSALKCRFEVYAGGLKIECMSSRATPETFRLALKLAAGVIE